MEHPPFDLTQNMVDFIVRAAEPGQRIICFNQEQADKITEAIGRLRPEDGLTVFIASAPPT